MHALVKAARAAGVEDERVLAAIASVPRSRFVPVERAGLASSATGASLPEYAPFDAILVAAACPDVPEPLAEQLAEGGRLVQPLGLGGPEDVVLFEKRGGVLRRVRSVTGAHFVRLHGRYGFR